MLSDYTVFVESAPRFRIEDGLVHIEDQSGNLTIRRVMSLPNFRRSLALAHELLAKYEVNKLDRVEVEPVPISRGRRPRKEA